MSRENLDLLTAAALDSLNIEAASPEGVVLQYFMARAYQEGEKDRRSNQYGAGNRRYEDVKL